MLQELKRDLATPPQSARARSSRGAIDLPLTHVHARERLLDEVALALHRRVARLPAQERAVIERLHDPRASLAGKRALVVDDDLRNTFARKTTPDAHGMSALAAETGRAASTSFGPARRSSVLQECPSVARDARRGGGRIRARA